MKKPLKYLLINTNPALWLVLTYILLLILVIAFNFERFSFEDANLFTFFYTFISVILLHTILNWKRFRLFLRQDLPEPIYKSYLQLTWLCLPYLLIAVVYENLILFSLAFDDIFKNVDLLLLKIDKAMFGVQPTIRLQEYLHPFAVDYFMAAYTVFFLYPFFYLIYLLQKNRLDVFYRVITAQVVSLIISLSCYIVLPAMGPRFVFDPDYPKLANHIPEFTKPLRGIQFDFLLNLTGRESFYALQYDMWNTLERIKTDCMPSMHVCLFLVCLVYVFKYRDMFKWKKSAIAFSVGGGISMVFSTVYLRYHWIIDIIAGFVLALIVYYVTEFIYQRWQMLLHRKKYPLHTVRWIAAAEKLQKSLLN